MEHWDLIAKEFAGEITPEEKTELNQWIADSQRNKEEYEKAKQAWELTEKKGVYQPNIEDAWKKVEAKTNTVVKTIPKSKSQGKSYWIAAIFAGIIGIGTLLNIWLNSPDITVLSASNTVEEFTLPDGSHIWLNKNSELSYTEDFNKKNRELKLNGEAYFDVTKNPDKPFTVDGKISKVTVLGTSFSLTAFDHQKISKLVVSEGKVSFSDGKEEAIFVQGETGILSDTKGIEKFIADPNELAWKKGFLEYQDELLSSVFSDIELNYGLTIETNNKSINNCKFTGTLTTKNIDEVIETLSFTNGLMLSKKGEKLIVDGDGC